jgi:hypothetical protein
MTADIHEGPLPSAPAETTPARKLSWREKRWERRRKRRFAEEVLGWILVPAILIGSYWIVNTILEGLGTSVPAIVNGIQAIIAGQI